MRRIINWSAFRSGAHLTVVGLDENSAEVKLTGIKEITGKDGKVVAGDGESVVAELVA